MTVSTRYARRMIILVRLVVCVDMVCLLYGDSAMPIPYHVFLILILGYGMWNRGTNCYSQPGSKFEDARSFAGDAPRQTFFKVLCFSRDTSR